MSLLTERGTVKPFRTSSGEAANLQMANSLEEIIDSYDPNATLAEASTIPSSWYTDERIFALEQQTVFGTWQVAARLDQVRDPGRYVTVEIGGEPIVIVRGSD